MKRLCLTLAVLTICLSGCAEIYTVHVNGFAEVQRPIHTGAPIYVATYEKSRNPLFDKEVKRKIEQLFRRDGYVPSAKEELADFRLGFEIGIDSRKLSALGSPYVPTKTGYGGYSRHHYFAYSTYVPYAEITYDEWLMLKVSDTGRLNPARKGTVVWVGEAVTSRISADIREAINYLLIGTFEYFGQDTKHRMRIELSADDPRIKEIMEYR